MENFLMDLNKCYHPQNFKSISKNVFLLIFKNCVLKLSLKLLQLDNGKDILKLFEKMDPNETVPSHVSHVLVEKCRASESRLLFMKIVLQLQLEEHYAEVLEVNYDCEQ